MHLDDLTVELLEGLRDGRDRDLNAGETLLAEWAFEFATSLNRAAQRPDHPELAEIAEWAKTCIGVIEGSLDEGLDFEIRLPQGTFRLGTIVAALRRSWEGEGLLVKLAERFDRARLIASHRRRTLRTDRAEFVTFSNQHTPRPDMLPALRAWTRQRGPSRQTRASRRVRPPARAPARPGDEPPPDRLARPSAQERAA